MPAPAPPAAPVAPVAAERSNVVLYAVAGVILLIAAVVGFLFLGRGH
jgi:hypothetical protein